MKRLRRCASFHYTLQETCPRCGGPSQLSHPAKYSPHDPYAGIRRRERYG